MNILIQDVTFTPEFNPDLLQFNEQLGFLEVTQEKVALRGVRLLGFGAPISRNGGYDSSKIIWPLTEYNQLPPENQNIDQQGKGVGPRMYNTRESTAGIKFKTDTLGVYTFDIDPDRLVDGRITQGNKIARIGRHAGRILRSKLTNTETVVDQIHASYGDSIDGVELEVPPLPELRQALQGVRNLADVKPQFILIRNPERPLHKVGTVKAP